MDGIDNGGNSAPVSAGPSTFAEAFASDASPATGTPAPSTTPAAAEQPTTDAAASTPVTDERSPFIPRARFDEVNTRLNELKQWKEQYGWAESADRQAIEQAVQIAQLYQSDRAGYIRQVLAEAIADPQLAPAVRSEAARLLGTRAQQAAPDQGPDFSNVVIDLGNGQTVPFAAIQDAMLKKAEEKFAPVVQTAEELKQERELAAAQAEADKHSKSFYAELQTLPDFKALEAQIKQRFSELVKTNQFPSDHPAEIKAAIYRIYSELAHGRKAADIANAKSAQLDDLQRRAAASTSPNPGSAAPSTPRSPNSFYDRSLTW